MSEVISSFRSLRAGSQVFYSPHVISLCDVAYYAVHLTLWYIVFVCYQYDVCEDSIGNVYVGGYCGLSDSECVFGKLCPVDFLVVCECSSVLLQSVVMSYVDCGADG